MSTGKQRGRPKKNPEDKVNWKYMAVYRSTYWVFKTKANNKGITLVNYMKLLEEIDL